MVDRAVKLQSKSTSYDLAQGTQRLTSSKLQDLYARRFVQISYVAKKHQAALALPPFRVR